MCSDCYQSPCHSQCPNNTDDPYEVCDTCGQAESSGKYIDTMGCPVGCTECVDVNENTGSLQCDCDDFAAETETIYTRHDFTLDGDLEVLGCSECLRFDEEC